MTAQPHTFATLLRRFRLAASLTQEALAEQTQLSSRTISDLERGVKNRPHPHTLEQLAQALNLDQHERQRFIAAARGLATPTMTDAPTNTAPNTRRGAATVPLIGRQNELAAIERHLNGDEAPLLLLGGEPGIGKSRLLRETIAMATASGWLVLSGGCTRRSAQEPYSPLLETLASFVATRSRAQLRADLEGASWLTRLLPELADWRLIAAPTWSVAPEQERRLMFTAVARFLANIAGSTRLLIVLDDLQWARADALDLLAHLIYAVDGQNVRFIGAYRTTDVSADDPLPKLRAEFVAAQRCVTRNLDHLSADESYALLTRALEGSESAEEGDSRAAREIAERAGGNPYFLVSYARGVREGALQRDLNGAPQNVRETIQQRLAALPGPTQELLRVAALIGRTVQRILLGRVMNRLGFNQRTLMAGLETACRARLLAEDGASAYVFTHDLIREVVASEMSAVRRAFLHRRIVAALEQERSRQGAAHSGFPDLMLPQLAYHASHADIPKRAVVYLERAGDQARMMSAADEAQSYYRALIAHLEALFLPLAAARARIKLGVALADAARYGEAVEVFQQAIDTLFQARAYEEAGMALAQLGRVQAVRGAPEVGIAQLYAYLEHPLVASLQAEVRGRILLALTQLCRIGGQYAKMLAAAESVATSAVAANSAELSIRAEQERGTALLMLGRNEEGAQVLQTALTGLETLADHTALARALNTLSVVHESSGDFAQAGRDLTQANEHAQLSQDPTLITFMLSRRATHAYDIGDWGAARADYQRAIVIERQIGSSWAAPYPLLGMGRLEVAMGDWERAEGYLYDALSVIKSIGDIQAEQNAQLIYAEADLLAGNADAAVARLAPLLSTAGKETDDSSILAPLMCAYDALGDAEKADALLARALKREADPQGQLEMINVRRAQGQIYLRRGRYIQAEAAAQTSLSLAQRIGLPYPEVRAWLILGEISLAIGARHEAQARLQRALALCDRLGERCYRPHIERALAAVQ